MICTTGKYLEIVIQTKNYEEKLSNYNSLTPEEDLLPTLFYYTAGDMKAVYKKMKNLEKTSMI